MFPTVKELVVDNVIDCGETGVIAQLDSSITPYPSGVYVDKVTKLFADVVGGDLIPSIVNEMTYPAPPCVWKARST